MSDPDSRWQPSASLAVLRQRAALLQAIRTYFAQQAVLEVETPILSTAATVDEHIDSFATDFKPTGQAQPQTYYLHTSPEYAMKRLLAAGSGDIYSLGRVFRNGECGRQHNPEFTLLEWYRVGSSLHGLMDDVTQLLSYVTDFKEQQRYRYGALFEQCLGVNPHTASDCTLQRLVQAKVDAQLTALTRHDCLDLLFSHSIVPCLVDESISAGNNGIYIYDFPATMSALAQLQTDVQGETVAARFELFVNGVELANGYQELRDPQEQQQRFSQAQHQRQAQGLPVYPMDHRLIAALAQGLPPCAGVALGVDRLLMLMLEATGIAEVMAFDFTRA